MTRDDQEVAVAETHPGYISTPLREWLLCEAREGRIRPVEVAFCAPQDATHIAVEAELRMHDAYYQVGYWEMRIGTGFDNLTAEEGHQMVVIRDPGGSYRL